jgi:hypothetical protein
MLHNSPPDLAYFRTKRTGSIFIVRFCTKNGLVAARLCYVPAKKGRLNFKGSCYRKVELHEELLKEYKRISAFPMECVYLVPRNEVEDLIDPFAEVIFPSNLDPVANEFMAAARDAVEAKGGQLGTIGSILLGAPLTRENDIDLVVAGESAWAAVSDMVVRYRKQRKLVWLDWRTNQADRYRKEIFQLNDCDMDLLRSFQWWRHFYVGTVLFSLSYSRGIGAKEIAFSFLDQRDQVLIDSNRRETVPGVPYRVHHFPQSESRISGAATLCWFFRHGFGGVPVRICGQIVQIEDERWVWLSRPEELTFNPMTA